MWCEMEDDIWRWRADRVQRRSMEPPDEPSMHATAVLWVSPAPTRRNSLSHCSATP